LKALTLAALLYAVACVLVASESDVLVAALTRLPRWLGIVLFTSLGPASFLLFEDGGSIFAAVIAMVVACAAASWIAWRRWPEAEWFAVPLLIAVVVWACSAWMPVIAIIA
jgi:hypothetical protein